MQSSTFVFAVLCSMMVVAMAAPTPTAPGTPLCANANWNSHAAINCPAGQVVDVVSYAWFGKASQGPCGSYVAPDCGYDVKADFNTKCDGLTTCDVMNSQYVFPTKYQDALKDCSQQKLYVQYTCKVNEEAPLVCATADENAASATLQCPAGSVIDQISYANYGTKPSGTCGSYANSACVHDILSSSQVAACYNKASCALPTSNGVWTDPCVGTYKNVHVQYTCKVQKSLALIMDTSDPNTVVFDTVKGVVEHLAAVNFAHFNQFFFSSWALTDPLVVQADSAPHLKTAIATATSANKIFKVGGQEHNDWAYMFGYLEAQLKIVGQKSAIVVALDEEMLCDSQVGVLRPNHQETYTANFQAKATELKTIAKSDNIALHFVVFPSSAQGFCKADAKTTAVSTLQGMATFTSGSFANAVDIISHSSIDAAGDAVAAAIVSANTALTPDS